MVRTKGALPTYRSHGLQEGFGKQLHHPLRSFTGSNSCLPTEVTYWREHDCIYLVGMIVTDLQFPRPDQAQYNLFSVNRQVLLNSGTGVSFYDGINALKIREDFCARYARPLGKTPFAYLKKVGLIVCEHIWPWEAVSRPVFLLGVVRGLLAQMSSIPKIVLLRSADVQCIRADINAISRVEIIERDDIHLHYQPLRMNWDSPAIDPIYGAECAIYIKPIQNPSGYIVKRPLHVPREVLLQMFEGKQTLFLASGTCGSPVACLEYLMSQLKLHNIPPPNGA